MKCKFVPKVAGNISASYLEFSSILNPDDNPILEDKTKLLYNLTTNKEFINDYKKYNSIDSLKSSQQELTTHQLKKYINSKSVQVKYPAISQLIKDLDIAEINSTLSIIESLSSSLGIEYSLENNDNDVIAEYKDNKIVFNLNNINNKSLEEIAFHEFTHPIIDHIEINNKGLLSRLLRDAKKVLGKDEVNAINKAYTKEDRAILDKEIIVKAIDKIGKKESKDIYILDRLKAYFKDFLEKFIGKGNLIKLTLGDFDIESLEDINLLLRTLPNNKTNLKVKLDTDISINHKSQKFKDTTININSDTVGTIDEVTDKLFNITNKGISNIIQNIEEFTAQNRDNCSTIKINEYISTLEVLMPNGVLKEIRYNGTKDLDLKIEQSKQELINALEEYSNNYSTMLSQVMNMPVPETESDTILYLDALAKINSKYTPELLSGLANDINNEPIGETVPYSIFKENNPSLGLPLLEDEDILISVVQRTNSDGTINNVYHFIAPYSTKNDTSKNDVTFGAKLQSGSTTRARDKGLTLGDNIVGLKSFKIGLIAMKIMNNDPAAKIGTAKAFYKFNPKLQEIDVNNAIENIIALGTEIDNYMDRITTHNEKKVFSNVKSIIEDLLIESANLNRPNNAESISSIDGLSSKDFKEYTKKFGQSYIQLLFSHDMNRKTKEGTSYSLFSDFYKKDVNIEKDQDKRDALKNTIKARLRRLMDNYNSASSTNQDFKVFEDTSTKVGKEFLILSLALEELDGTKYGSDLSKLNSKTNFNLGLEKWIKGQGDHFDKHITFVFQNVRRIMRIVKEKYMLYQSEKNKYFEEYFKGLSKDQSFINKSKEALFNYKEDLYVNLFETAEVRVMDKTVIKVRDAEGNVTRAKKAVTRDVFRPDKVTVKTGKLKNPNSSSLKDFEKDLILKVANKNRETIKKLVESKWKNKELPQVYQAEKNFETAFKLWEKTNLNAEFNGTNNKDTKWGNYLMMPAVRKDVLADVAVGNFKDAANNYLETEFNMNNVSMDKETDISFKSLGMLEAFMIKSTTSMDVNNIFGNRLTSLGLEESDTGEVYLVNENANKSVSLDLQGSADFYQMKLMKQEYMNELNYTYQVGRVGLLNEKVSKMTDTKSEQEVLKAMFDAIIHDEIEGIVLKNKGINIAKYINVGTALVSKSVLSYNIPSAIIAGIGGNVSTFINALVQKYGDRFFSFTDWKNAVIYVMNPKNQKKVHAIMHLMQFHSTDEKSLVFNENLKAGGTGFKQAKGVLVGRNSMQLQGYGDYIARSTILIGQLQRDGILEFFKFDKKGDLYYDWKAEKAAVNEELNSTKKSKISSHRKFDRELNKKTLLDNGRAVNKDGDPLVPYDDTMMDSLSTISGHILGQITDDQKGYMYTNVLVKGFMQMKSYIAARVNNLWSVGGYNPNIAWYAQNVDGSVKMEHYYQEGALNTILFFGKSVFELGIGEAWKDLKPEQKKNLQKILLEACIFALAFAAFGEEDKENPYNYYIKSAVYDVIGIYNPVDYIEAIQTPVSLVYAQRLFTALGDGMQFEFDSAMKMSGLTKNYGQVTGYLDFIEKQTE